MRNARTLFVGPDVHKDAIAVTSAAPEDRGAEAASLAA